MPELEFLNADLELVSKKEPRLLLEELKKKVTVLYSAPDKGGHLTTMEVGVYAANLDPVKTVKKWVAVLESLSPAARREFANATSRVMDLGFDIRDHKQAVQIKLPEKLLASLVRWNMNYVITLYSRHLFEPLPKVNPPARR
jgi:hypothetical protein